MNSNNGFGDIGHSKIVSADIAFIGSGIACTVTLTSLFEKLLVTKPNKTLLIIVIENHQEFWKGIPYGSRSSVNGLTITTASDFLQMPRNISNSSIGLPTTLVILLLNLKVVVEKLLKFGSRQIAKP